MTPDSLFHFNGSNGASNGSNGAVASGSPWLQQTVEQFFRVINWEDHPPEVQHLRQQTAAQSTSEPVSLLLTVSQYFGAIAWDGNSVAQPPKPIEPDRAKEPDGFTLNDFSDLF
jgi:hypothetical protein